MTKYYVLLFFSCFTGSAFAQSVVFSEGFDEFPSYTITGWGSYFTGMVPWQAGLPHEVGGCMLPAGGPMSADRGTNKVACISDCGPFDYNNSNVFIATPAINMATVTGAWLRYDSYFEGYNNGSHSESADVEISTNGGATWAVIQHVPANPSLSNFHTWYIDLAAYSYMPDVRIGFRYSDSGGHMMGWAIDNIQVIVPAQKDLALYSVTPRDSLLSYVVIGQGYTHHATVFNAGLDTIHSFTLNYRQGAGTIKTYSVTGVILLPFASMDVVHNIPDTITASGNFPVTVWVSASGDTSAANDTLHTRLNGAGFMPQKRLLAEEGEGTWDGWSPRNAVYLHSLADSGSDACKVSAHQYDPMEYTFYSDFLTGLYDNYVPYILLDRRRDIPIDSFFSYVGLEKQYFGYADITVNTILTDNELSVTGTITPAVDMAGDYSVALMLTEDSVHSNDSGYAQVNNYAGGTLGAMGGYEALPNPVPASAMYYDYVARLTSANPCGVYGFIPSPAISGTPYDYSLSATLSASWNTGHMKAIVLLIDNSDSIVLNSNEAPVTVPSRVSSSVTPAIDAGIYPNPCSENAHLYFGLATEQNVHISICDMSGRMAYKYPLISFGAGRNEITLPIEHLQDGIYLVTICTDECRRTLKLEVMH